nr:MAG TPA: hypothetical protein [Caudoviricetes sp.]
MEKAGKSQQATQQETRKAYQNTHLHYSRFVSCCQ